MKRAANKDTKQLIYSHGYCAKREGMQSILWPQGQMLTHPHLTSTETHIGTHTHASKTLNHMGHTKRHSDSAVHQTYLSNDFTYIRGI